MRLFSLLYLCRRKACRTHRDGFVWRRRAQDCRELSRSLHWRKGNWKERKASALQGIQGIVLFWFSVFVKRFSFSSSTASFLTSCSKVATSRTELELEESPSTEISSMTRTLSFTTLDLVFSPWQTLVPTPTDLRYQKAEEQQLLFVF